MKLLALAADPGATITEIRLRLPLAALCERTGWPLRLLALSACSWADLLWADVLVMQRGVGRRALALERRMASIGGRVVYEIDDLLVDPAPHLEHAQAMGAMRDLVMAAISAADLVTASTARLADALRPLAREVVVVPNYGAPTTLRVRPAADDARPVTLLFASSDRIVIDAIAPALRQLVDDAAGRLRVVAIGACADALAAQGVRLQAEALLPRAQFLARIAALEQPVGVIPVDDSRFSACKSAIKYFDYAMLGVPTLCSNLAPYADVIADGETGLLVDNTPAAWLAALQRIVADAALRRRLSEAAHASVSTRFTLDHTVRAWEAALRRLAPRPHTAGTRWARFAAGLWIAPDALACALRGANRARLERRNRARAGGAAAGPQR